MERAGGRGSEDHKARAHAHLPCGPAHLGVGRDARSGSGGLEPESEQGLARYPPGVLRGTGGRAGWPRERLSGVEGESSELGVPGLVSGIEGPVGGIEVRRD